MEEEEEIEIRDEEQLRRERQEEQKTIEKLNQSKESKLDTLDRETIIAKQKYDKLFKEKESSDENHVKKFNSIWESIVRQQGLVPVTVRRPKVPEKKDSDILDIGDDDDKQPQPRQQQQPKEKKQQKEKEKEKEKKTEKPERTERQSILYAKIAKKSSKDLTEEEKKQEQIRIEKENKEMAKNFITDAEAGKLDLGVAVTVKIGDVLRKIDFTILNNTAIKTSNTNSSNSLKTKIKSGEVFVKQCEYIKREFGSFVALNRGTAETIHVELKFENLLKPLFWGNSFGYDEGNMLRYIKHIRDNKVLSFLKDDYNVTCVATMKALIFNEKPYREIVKVVNATTIVDYKEQENNVAIEEYHKDEGLLFLFPPNLFFMYAVLIAAFFKGFEKTSYFVDKYGEEAFNITTVEQLHALRTKIDLDYKKFASHHRKRRQDFLQANPTFFEKLTDFEEFWEGENASKIMMKPDDVFAERRRRVQFLLPSRNFNPSEPEDNQ
jgi:hypothetical protein